jgi:hypothetical protein
MNEKGHLLHCVVAHRKLSGPVFGNDSVQGAACLQLGDIQ